MGEIRHVKTRADAGDDSPDRHRRKLVERLLPVDGRKQAHGAGHVEAPAPQARRRDRPQAPHTPNVDTRRGREAPHGS